MALVPAYGSRSVAVEHPIGCPICGRGWRFVTDGINGIGVVKAVHADGPCVPLPPVPIYNERITECQYEPCGREFEKKANAQRFCSSKCRDAHNNENPRARESARQRASRTYWLNREVRKYQKRRAA